MNKDRFFELLNLYLDDEIAMDDLGDLMDETRRDAERRKVFLEYCRIHKACTSLGSSFGDRSRRRSLRQTVYALGGLAAAFALIGMAGRNLLPLISGNSSEAIVAEQSDLASPPSFFPEPATDSFASTDFYFVGLESLPSSLGAANLQVFDANNESEWSDNLVSSRQGVILNLGTNSRSLSEILETESRDFYERFDAFNDSNVIEFSSAASFPPASSFGQTVGRDSRSNLK